MESPHNHNDDAVEKALREVATRDLYRVNSFRILGLSTNATMVEIRGCSKKLEVSRKVGQTAGLVGVNFVPPYPETKDVAEIQRAIHRLQDPLSRLVDEVFWFWPMDPNSDHDPAIQLLVQSNPGGAVEIWNEASQTLGLRAASRHNLAVLYHMWALWFEEPEHVEQVTEDKARTRQSYWNSTFGYWHQSLVYPGFRKRIESRVKELSDPRIPADLAGTLIALLPTALVGINISLAIAAAKDNSTDTAERHLRHVSESPFDRAVVAAAIGQQTEPLLADISTRCKEVTAVSDADPSKAGQVAERLLSDTKAILAALELVMAPDDTSHISYEDDEATDTEDEDPYENVESSASWSLRLDGAHDQVADALRSCAISLGNEAKQWEKGLEVLVHARRIAHRIDLRQKLDEDIKTVREILDSACNQQASDFVEKANQATREGDLGKAAGLLKKAYQVCRDPAYKNQIAGWLRDAEAQASQTALRSLRSYDFEIWLRAKFARISALGTRNLRYGIVILAVVIIIVVLKLFASGPSVREATQPTSPAPYASALPGTPPSYGRSESEAKRSDVTQPTPTSRSSLESRIEIGKAALKGLESDISGMDSRLGVIAQQIDLYKQGIRKYESAARAGLDVDEDAYDSAIKRHNALVEQYNSLSLSRNSKYSAYEAKIQYVNSLVEQYNSGSP